MKEFSASWRKHATKVLKKGHRPLVDLTDEKEIIDNEVTIPRTATAIEEDAPLKKENSNEEITTSVKDDVAIGKAITNTAETEETNPKKENPSDEPTTSEDEISSDEMLDEITLPTHEELLFDIPEHALNHNTLLAGYSNGKHPFNIPATATKINSIVNEMSKLKLDPKNGFPYAALFLMRSFIELSCKHYVAQKDSKIKLNEQPSLAKQVLVCISHMEASGLFRKDEEDSRNIDSLKALCNEKSSQKSIRNIQYLQNTLHHPRLLWDKENINAFWYAILPFLIKCYE